MRRVGNKQAAPTATQNVKIDIDIETQNIQNQIKLHWMEYDTKCFKECAKMFVENFAATEVTEHWHGTCVCMRRGIHLHSRFFSLVAKLECHLIDKAQTHTLTATTNNIRINKYYKFKATPFQLVRHAYKLIGMQINSFRMDSRLDL